MVPQGHCHYSPSPRCRLSLARPHLPLAPLDTATRPGASVTSRLQRSGTSCLATDHANVTGTLLEITCRSYPAMYGGRSATA